MLIDLQHSVALTNPVLRKITIRKLVKIRPAHRVVHVLRTRVEGVVADQVVPSLGQLANGVIAPQPFELVQFQAAGGVDVAWAESLAAGVVEQHDAAPVLLGVGRLRRAKELHRLTRAVLVLDAHDGVAVVAQIPQFGDICPHQHVAVHEQAPPLKAAEVRHQEAGEAEIGALQRVTLTPETVAQVLQRQGDEGHRARASRQDAVTQDMPGDGFPGVKADEDADHLDAAGAAIWNGCLSERAACDGSPPRVGGRGKLLEHLPIVGCREDSGHHRSV